MHFGPLFLSYQSPELIVAVQVPFNRIAGSLILPAKACFRDWAPEFYCAVPVDHSIPGRPTLPRRDFFSERRRFSRRRRSRDAREGFVFFLFFGFTHAL